MKDTIGIEQFNKIRNEFKVYLGEKNQSWDANTISTVASDAFFILNNNVGLDFWGSLVNEESLLVTRDRIHEYLRDLKGSERANERANGYLSALRQFKAFLDDKYPDLALEWRGKAISDSNLKNSFQIWLRKQKKTTGESYSQNTINTYIASLRGQIQVTGSIKQMTLLKGKLVCAFDEFLPDTVHNQALKSIMLLLLHHGEVKQDTKKLYTSFLCTSETFQRLHLLISVGMR